MKKKFRISMLFLTLAMLFVLSVPVSAASTKTKALNAYKQYLSRNKITISVEGGSSVLTASKLQFALVYLDNDDIPELIIDNTPNLKYYNAAGYAIFTYKNGKMKQLASQNSTCRIKRYYPKTNLFYLTGIYFDNDVIYTRVRGSLFRRIIEKNGSEYWDLRSGDVKEITKSKYNTILKKYAGSAKAVTIKYYKNTAANRKKYLK